ncbi:FapA family protein [Metabacillus sp. FJAT-52054]|uniref:FapA family protein n=1 Tax=Metabacillus sediminis TaxID=3117746 RepID=A0ABZ2NIK3_9BACI
MVLTNNEFFHLEEENGTIYLTVMKEGYMLSNFNQLLEKHPRISITSFQNLKKGMEEASGQRTPIAQYLPLITHTISQDKMTASVKILAAGEEFNEIVKDLPRMIMDVLSEKGVTEGFLLDSHKENLKPLKWIEAAKGIEPVHGIDAVIRTYDLSERRPVIEETGRANFYNMNFIDEVEEGDWLGEKISPTDGTNGMNVLGEELKARKGKDKRLQYDPNSVRLSEEDGRSVLRAGIRGIVSKTLGKISIANHLLIEGDVGIGTGNIEFEGSVTVKGTVQEGFSVKAGIDIAVMSELGVRQVGLIESLNGDIFIKGGVFGHGTIKAAKNIFVKHANECTLTAGEDIHIGFYAKGSSLQAKNVITEQHKGKIFGGHIIAKGKVYASEIGNKIELKTLIQVEGFERSKLKEEYMTLLNEYKQAIQSIEEIQRHLEIYENFAHNLNASQQTQLEKLKIAHDGKLKEISVFEQKRTSLMKMLETKGDGEISIFEKAYPETYIEIKNMKKKVDSLTKGTFYASGRELKYE